MDTKPITDYLNELSTPSLVCSPNEPVNPLDIERYLNEVDTLRVAFVAAILACENSAVKTLYEEELKQAISKIEKRGYCNLKEENISAAILGGIKEMELVNQVVRLDKGLLASAEKALAVLFPTKEEKASDTIEEPKPATEDKTTKKIVESSYLDGHQVHEMFGIAYNNIKSKQWRDENNFPYRQPTGEGGRVVYIREEVEEWIKNNGNRG